MLPVTVSAFRLQLVLDLAQDHRQAARLVEIFHVTLAGGLQIHQHRCLAAHFVEGIQIDLDAQSPRHRRQMHDGVGRTADREQHAQRILESLGAS